MECSELIKLFYEKILCNQVVLSLISGVVGAIIASKVTYGATKQAHENNIELEKLKEKETEKAVALSIIEELNVLFEIYGKEMEEYFATLKTENDFLKTYYIATLDFFTVYTNNSDKIGIISDKELRNSIVKIYVFLKKYLEDFNVLRMYHEDLASNKAVYSELVNISWRLKKEFEEIKSLYDVIIDKVDSTYEE